MIISFFASIILCMSVKDLVRHFFIPHRANNHRAKALHPKSFLFYILVLAVLQLSFKFVTLIRPDILGIATNINVDRLLEATNKEREQNGMVNLELNPELSLAAEKKAEDMFARNYWAHNGPNGSTPWDFIKGAGYTYIYAGENLAKDFQNSNDVVQAWMKSPSHRENILRKEYQDIGFAVVNGDLNGEETTLVIQMFGVSSSKSVAAKPESDKQIQIAVKPAETANTLGKEELVTSKTVDNNYALGVVALPLFDEGLLLRLISLLIMGSLLTILTIDGFLILRRRTVRIAGHNFAHFIFLLALISIVIISATGTIL